MTEPLPLLPWPQHVDTLWGRLDLQQGLRIDVPEGAGSRLRDMLARFGADLQRYRGTPACTPQAPVLRIDLPPGVAGLDPLPELGDDESFELRISGAGVELRAASLWGVQHGLGRLSQLLATFSGQALPALLIEDAPRHPWRGLMLDIARRFPGLPALLRTLDAMAVLGMNVLHLHLCDDQGFRVESRRWPRLTEVSAPGGFLTAEQVGTLVSAAADRGIRIVPEFDLPGHAGAILHAHPELAAGPVPEAMPRRFGVSRHALDPESEAARRFISELLDEMLELFPDRYVHIGGDEVHPSAFEAAHLRRVIGEAGLGDARGLQNRFNVWLHELLADRGRVALGWDEVLHPHLPDAVAVQAWRSVGALQRALEGGHDALLSAPWYLDLNYPADVHYRFDPALPPARLARLEAGVRQLPRLEMFADAMAHLNAQGDAATGATDRPPGRLLGGEACLWAELVDDDALDTRLLTRLPAIAERLWSAPEDCDEARFYRRLDAILRHIEIVTPARPLSGRPARWWRLGVLQHEAPHVEALIDALRPLPWYARHLGPRGLAQRRDGGATSGVRPYDADTPLNRPVDWAAPESLVARRVGALLAALRADPDDVQIEVALRDHAHRWRMAEHALTSLMTRSAVFAELEALAADLAQVADLLDDAVDALAERRPPPPRVLDALEQIAADGRSAGDLELAVLDALLDELAS